MGLLRAVSMLILFLTLGVGQMWAETTRVYCKMTYDWWKTDGAAIGIYAYGGGGENAAWPGVRMTPTGETDEWYADIDLSSYTALIFVRVNPTGDIADWGAKTEDLATEYMSDKNYFTITSSEAQWSGSGNTCTTNWTRYTPTGAILGSMVGTYNVLTKNSFSDGSISIDLDANTVYEFAIAGVGHDKWYSNGSAFVGQTGHLTFELNYGSQCKLATANAGTYTFNYNDATHEVTVTYPTVTHPNANYVYFSNPNEWSQVRAHVYTGATPVVEWANNPYLSSFSFAGHTYYYAAIGDKNSIIFTNYEQNVQTADLDAASNKGKYYNGTSWQNFTVSVSLNNQGATTAGAANVTATYGAAMPSIAANLPAKTGYTFGGYYSSANGEGTQYYNADGTSAHVWDRTGASPTLYAKWTANTYTVTLDRNNLISPTGSTTATMTYNSSTITDYTAPTKTGYSFGGYWTSETLNDGDGTMVIDDEGVLQENVDGYTGAGGIWIRTTATTLYAKWVELFYRVTFRHNGHGTIAVHGETVANGETAMVLHIITRSLEATPNPGYHFTGWTVTGDGAAHVTIADPSSASTTIKSSSGNATVTANFAPNVHDITYTAPTNGSYTIKAGDASVVSASVSDVDYATTITLAATPANACYAFTEWTVTGATPADASAPTTTFTMPDNDVTVAASFSQIDLAHNKTIYSGWSRTDASTGMNLGEIPAKAVDGNLETKHIQYGINTNYVTKGWCAVDLGANYVLSDIKIYWEDNAGRAPQSYEIQAAISEPSDFSNDVVMSDDRWHTIKTVSGVTQNLGSTANTLSFTVGEHAVARYLRLVNKDSEHKDMSILEFEAYGVEIDECYAANTLTASFAGIEDGQIKLNLSATNTNGDELTKFAIWYDGVYYDVIASEGVGYVILPSRRNITVRVYAYNICMERSSDYVEVAVGDYVNPDENLAELKTTWVSYTNNSDGEKQANLNDGILNNKGWLPWNNTGANPWMVVDLGDTYQISKVQTFFASATRTSTNYKIYGRQEDPSTDDVRGDNTKWIELASKSSSINTGSTESDVNESSVSFTGAIRYVRFESFAEADNDVQNSLNLLEFRVFGSAFKSRDLTGPVISTCEIDGSAENETSTVLHLVATDAVDGEVFNYEISTDGGSSWTKYSTDPSTRLVTISGLTSGTYIFAVRAYDVVGNYSSTRTVAVDIWDPDANLALNKTSWAGHETGGAGEAKDKANDGSLTTFWTSWDGANPDDDWWCVDLGNYYQLSEIDVFWHQITDGSINLHSEKYTIRARQTLTGTSSEMEAIMRDSTQWYLIARQSTTPYVGNTESDKNAYALNAPARYILLKSTQRNAINQQIRLSELRAYGSGFADADTHVPVITTATASYNDDGKAYLTLTAADEEDGTTNWFRIYNPYTETYSLQQTNGSNQIVIDGLPTCTNFTFRIQAMDKAAQLSAITNLTVNVPLISTDNIAPMATLTSGTNNGAGLNNLVDGNTGNTWEVAGGTVAGEDEWLVFQWDNAYQITTIKVYWETHAGGATRPKDYEWQVSNDGIHYVPVLHYTTKPGAEETYTLNATAEYVRLFVNKHDAYNGMCLREVEVHGACEVDTDLPVMLFAEPVEDKIYKTNATIYVGAIHKTIASDQLLYHVNINNGARELTVSAASVTNSQFTITGLTAETAYNVKIWAAKTSDIAGNRSANYKEVNFTTQDDYSSYYLANSINGWLGVNSGVWTDAMNEWRFRTTAVDGIYNLTHTVSVTENWTYLIYDRTHSTRTPGDRTASVTSGRDFVAVMRDLDHYVTNYSNLYVAGSAVGTAEDAHTTHNRLTWISATQAVWEGRVAPGGTYRITSYDNVLQTNFITPSAQTYGESYTHARLTFTFDDEADFTWTWEELPSEQFCERSGNAGSGAVLDGSAFGVGESYAVYAYMSAEGKWIVEATCSGVEAANAYVQPFTGATGTGRQEFAMTPIGNYFRVEIDPASITYKLNGLSRYVVKFAVPAGIRYTDVHYYDFSGDGECAPDYFDIYHHDDAASAPTGARTSFAGGLILQPIRYHRHFENADWTTVCIPFEVSKVTVYDNDDERDYPLYPRFNNGSDDVEGYYWLKTFSGTCAIKDFEAVWEQLTYSTAESNDDVLTTLVKPAKNTPYIIAFPDGSGYYETNWVVFHGAAGQTITSEFAGRSSIALTDGYEYSQVEVQGNNTMHASGTLTNIYMIEEGYDYFTRQTVAVPAFEAYLIGTEQVQQSYAALRYRGGPSVPTGTGNMPTTAGWSGTIYTVTGVQVASFADRDAMERSIRELSTGVYVISTQSQVNKIVVP